VGKPYPIPSSGSIARITLSLRLAGRVKQILRDERFDIVHLHEPLVPALPITVLRFSEAINVGTFHAYSGGNLGYYYGRRILKRWFRKLHGKIARLRAGYGVRQPLFPGLLQHHPQRHRLRAFRRRHRTDTRAQRWPAQHPFCRAHGKRKGLKYLLRAFVHVKREFPAARLVVVGPDGGSQ